MTLLVRLLTPTARAPQRSEPGSVGYDLHLDLGRDGATTTIEPLGRYTAHTSVAIAIPPGCYGRVAPRSGLASRDGIDVLAGVIDPSYRGDVCVLLYNTSDCTSVTLHHGDRIAQLILERCETPDVEIVDALPDSARGDKGFGSSGR